MEKTALPNLQDAFLNHSRRERLQVTIYLLSGIKLTGRIRGFDKYCVIMDGGSQEQLIFKHAISTVALPKGVVSDLPSIEETVKEGSSAATTSPAK